MVLQAPQPIPLPSSFFARPTLTVAHDIIGHWLVHQHPSEGLMAGRIVESEGYTQDDPAFRSWGVFDGSAGLVKPEGRALALFGTPGKAYVYLVYGSFWLLNIVTEGEGKAGAVLLRAAEPVVGEVEMWKRRPAARARKDLTNGPGKLTQAFDIDRRFHGHSLCAPPLYVAKAMDGETGPVASSPRIGLRFGVDLPYRFYVPGNRFVSPGPSSSSPKKIR